MFLRKHCVRLRGNCGLPSAADRRNHQLLPTGYAARRLAKPTSGRCQFATHLAIARPRGERLARRAGLVTGWADGFAQLAA